MTAFYFPTAMNELLKESYEFEGFRVDVRRRRETPDEGREHH